MKKFRRIMALLIASVMVLAMGATAFAADNYTITITAPENHTYEVFQVFTGTPEDGQLTSLKYGQNAATGTAGEAVSAADMEKLAEIAGKTYADDQAAIADLEQFVDMETAPIKTITSATASDALEPGYYVIRDTVTSDTPKDDGLTLYMFQVLDKDLSISAKSDKPESEKKVQDINDSEDTDYSDLQDSADHEIGDTIPYTLTFTLPDDYANFKAYYVNFKDHLSSGLTYNGDAKIFFGDSDTTGMSINFGSGQDLSYEIADLKKVDAASELEAGDVLTIKYTCYLNDDAVIGAEGNPNTYYVEFSRNPNWNGEGTPEKGETPEDVNIVFTYKTIFNKVDEANNPLEGADFELYKKVGDEWVLVTTLGDSAHPAKMGSSADKSTTFSFTGLDDGDYKLVETFTPAGYNPIEDIEFTITAEHDILSDNPQLTDLQGDGGAEFTMTPSVGEGSLSASVINKSGSVLPTTGGIGTTMFYVVGAILVVGAGVVLVTRRRMTV